MVEPVWLQNDKDSWLSLLMLWESAREKVIPLFQSAGTDCWISSFLVDSYIKVALPLAPSFSHVLQTPHEGVENNITVAPCSFRILHGKEHELKEYYMGFILFLPFSDGSHRYVVCTLSVLVISLWKTDHNITFFPTPWPEIRENLKLFNTVLRSLYKFDQYHLGRARIFISRPNKTNPCIWFLHWSSSSRKS